MVRGQMIRNWRHLVRRKAILICCRRHVRRAYKAHGAPELLMVEGGKMLAIRL